ncbi:MAG: outer membrane beta-barrel protein, partial [Saprospiraceae bacterium]
KSSIYWEGPEFGYPRDYKVVEDRFKETLNYLDLPLMVEKNFGGGSLGAYVSAGPGLSIAFNGKGREEVTVEFPSASETAGTRIDPTDYTIETGKSRYDLYKGFDINLNLGGGLVWILESGEIGLDLRYTQGLKMLNADGLKNRNLLFGVSYMHYIGQ